MDEKELNTLCEAVIQMTDNTIKIIEDYKCQNKQWFIDFLDKLNTLSIKY